MANDSPSKIPAVLKGLSEKDINALYRLASIKRLKRGDVLIREGDTDQVAYIILDGLMRVVKDVYGEPEEIATLGEGDWVGEIAFTRKMKRTASAIAKTPVSVMAIDGSTIAALDSKAQVFFYKQLNDLATSRVSSLSTREAELADKNQKLMGYIQAFRGPRKEDYQNSEMIRGIIQKVPRLPAFATELAIKILDGDISPAEAAEHVKEDPALVALILKTVNSPYYGLRSAVADIHHAIVLLGFNEVYQLVVTEGMRRTMPNTPGYRALLAHSVAISHLCFFISMESRIGRPAEAATVGILHDLGVSLIQLLKERNPRMSMLLDALDSSQLGAMLLREWKLPESINRSVEFQYYPEFSGPAVIPEDVRNNVTILYLSHLAYAYLSGQPLEKMPTALLEEYTRLVGWEGQTIVQMVDRRLKPNLQKKINTFPASLRHLLEGPRKRKASPAGNVAARA